MWGCLHGEDLQGFLWLLRAWKGPSTDVELAAAKQAMPDPQPLSSSPKGAAGATARKEGFQENAGIAAGGKNLSSRLLTPFLSNNGIEDFGKETDPQLSVGYLSVVPNLLVHRGYGCGDGTKDEKHRGWRVVRKKKNSIRELLSSVKPHMAYKVESA